MSEYWSCFLWIGFLAASVFKQFPVNLITSCRVRNNEELAYLETKKHPERGVSFFLDTPRKLAPCPLFLHTDQEAVFFLSPPSRQNRINRGSGREFSRSDSKIKTTNPLVSGLLIKKRSITISWLQDWYLKGPEKRFSWCHKELHHCLSGSF